MPSKKKSKPVWKCKEGCDLSTGRICPHLEKLLPCTHGVKGIPVGEKYLKNVSVSPVVGPDRAELYEEQVQRLISKLKAWGLRAYDVDVLVKLYAEDKSLRDTARELLYMDKDTLMRHRNRIFDYLRPILVEERRRRRK